MQPNIVVIVLDALRKDRVGSLGGRKVTPNIDELASDSVKFTNAFTTTNATDPAVTSLQTGRYPISSGLINHGRRVTNQEKKTIESVVQIPEILSEAGYRTAKFGRPLGRWHRNGFDSYPSFSEGRAPMERREETGQKRPGHKTDVKTLIANTLSSTHPKFLTAASKVYQKTVKPIEESINDSVNKNTENDRDHVVENVKSYISNSTPFFAFIHLMDPHGGESSADPELVREYLKKFDYGVKEGENVRVSDEFKRLISAGEYPEIVENYYRPDGTPTTAIGDAHYDASVTNGDTRVGEILDSLKAENVFENTLIIFLADHGESLTEHGIYYDHHGLYDVSVRIPLIIRPPGGREKTVDDLVQITDIAPTIESYINSNKLDPDGYSLQSVIERDSSVNRDYIMAEEAHTQRRRMVRSTTDKMIYLLDNNTICRYCEVEHAPEKELYDLTSDPGEQRNISHDRRSIVEDLKLRGDELEDEYRTKQPDIGSDEAIDYDDEKEVHDRLEALGYR